MVVGKGVVNIEEEVEHKWSTCVNSGSVFSADKLRAMPLGVEPMGPREMGGRPRAVKEEIWK
uniref:Uncharacterized protein n=1 Tax=Candidozyma auris TaxID=498019 RepID=A0A0L0P1Z3_CANAR